MAALGETPELLLGLHTAIWPPPQQVRSCREGAGPGAIPWNGHHGCEAQPPAHEQLLEQNGRLWQLCRMEGDLSRGYTGIPGKIIMG